MDLKTLNTVVEKVLNLIPLITAEQKSRGLTAPDSVAALAPLAPSRVLLELVELWISSFHAGELHLDGRMTCRRGGQSDWRFVDGGSDSWLPGGCRAADRRAPAAPACTPHPPSRGRPSSSSPPSSASSEDLSYKPDRGASWDSGGSCCLKLLLIFLGSAVFFSVLGWKNSPSCFLTAHAHMLRPSLLWGLVWFPSSVSYKTKATHKMNHRV